MKTLIITIIAAVVVTACAPIEHQTELTAGAAQTQATVGVGGVVAQITKTRDVKSVYGAADIWG
jgi:hypothetical protein